MNERKMTTNDELIAELHRKIADQIRDEYQACLEEKIISIVADTYRELSDENMKLITKLVKAKKKNKELRNKLRWTPVSELPRFEWQYPVICSTDKNDYAFSDSMFKNGKWDNPQVAYWFNTSDIPLPDFSEEEQK
jgi:hypothetical protein